ASWGRAHGKAKTFAVPRGRVGRFLSCARQRARGGARCRARLCRSRLTRLLRRAPRRYHAETMPDASPKRGREMVMSTATQGSEFDSPKSEASANRLLPAVNHGAFCLMASVGHRTGLFDAMRGLPAATSEEIAKKANLNERYVREWLGAMVTADVV